MGEWKGGGGGEVGVGGGRGGGRGGGEVGEWKEGERRKS